MSDLIGQRFGQLRIVEQLGEGGMGVVFAAVHEKLGRRVAVKVLADHRRLNPEARARFLREAQILSQLSHRNICQIHDYVEGDEQDFIVLELVNGTTLRRVIADDRSETATFAIAEQILEALAAAHGQDIVHRDLKPENIMLTPDRVIKVLDFGFARSIEDLSVTEIHPPHQVEAEASSSSFRTHVGAVTGTLDYMSPEQARGEQATPSSDVFSAGLVFQELFGSERPRLQGSIAERLEEVARGKTPPVEVADSDIAALIERMKSRAPANRPRAVDALERLRWIRKKPRRRLKRALAAIAIAVLVTLSVALAWQLRRAHAAIERAEKAWSEAESLTAFMLEDLIERLRPLGRLDLLDQVADEALRYYREIPSEQHSAERSYRHGLALRTLGQVLELEGRWQEAESMYRDVLTNAQALVDRAETTAEDDTAIRYRQNLQHAWDDLGDVLLAQDRLAEAEEAFRNALELAKQHVEDDPRDLDRQAVLATAWDDLGGLFQHQGNLERAEEAYREALAVDQRLAIRDPNNSTWHSSLARDYHRLGTVLEERGNLALARASFEEALTIDRELSRTNPGDTEHAMNFSQALFDVARVSLAEDKPDKAILLLEEGTSIDSLLAAQDPSNIRWLSALGEHCLVLGDAYLAAGNESEAIARWQQARSALAAISTTTGHNHYTAVLERLAATETD